MVRNFHGKLPSFTFHSSPSSFVAVLGSCAACAAWDGAVGLFEVGDMVVGNHTEGLRMLGEVDCSFRDNGLEGLDGAGVRAAEVGKSEPEDLS